MTGPVTIGGSSGASLAPGITSASDGTVVIEQTLTIRPSAKYKVTLNSTAASSGTVIANEVTLESGANIDLRDNGSGTLPLGTVFVLIGNTAVGPVAGTFSNLPDNSLLSLGLNKFEASYEGGDGNNLTLTVVQ